MTDQPDVKQLGSLLGLLVHDLRNALSALHSNLDFLLSTLGGIDPDTRGALEDAAVSCDSLVGIVDNAELLGLYLQGAMERPVEPVALAAVVEDVVARQRPLARSHGVELVVEESARDVEARVVAHREMYARAFVNLLRNAIQHGGPGRVRVWAEVDAGQLRLVIGDNGPALAQAYRETAMTFGGQLKTKGQAGGRYGRGFGLLAARLAAQSSGARVEIVDAPSEVNCAFALSAPVAPRRRTERPPSMR